MNEPGAGLYLHVPFCDRVCPYCDFAVRTGDERQRESYVESLLREIDLYADCTLTFDTIYFGGGTPSCLTPDQLERIVEQVRSGLKVAPDPWIFLEANPEDVDAAKTVSWKQLGVRTVSLGVQSFDDDELSFLGRAHDGRQAAEAIDHCRAAGFHTVSIDLIYGLPDQTTPTWLRRLDRALKTEPDHISCYQLTIHEKTRFAELEKNGTLVQLGEPAQGSIFRATHEYLNSAGYSGYEVSQFARDREHRSRHNQKYWNRTPYLGLGPSAHSFDGARRWWNRRNSGAWQQALEAGERPVEASEELSRKECILEMLMTGFRTYHGVDCHAVRSDLGVDLIELNRDLLARLQESGLLRQYDGRLIPTIDGLAVADSLATMLRY